MLSALRVERLANLKSAQRSKIWGQHFSTFPEHLIREMLFKVLLHVSIVVDIKTVNWFMKDNLATALNCSLDNATRDP